MGETTGLYLHIPFCQKRCNYCAFLTFDHKDDMIQRYVDYLIREMALYRDKELKLDTIYFGGGTPSYLSASQMTDLMSAIHENFEVSDDCETTIEMNPESVTPDRIEAYLEAGINRFSMGVQSFNDEVLQIMGRLHNARDVYERMALLRSFGCDNISIDLMFSNPKQSMEVLEDDLDKAIDLNTEHLSIYSLMYKEGSNFTKWLKSGKIQAVDDETDREMYHLIQRRLTEAGFHQYEISSFAKPGRESRHNLKYWTQKDYLGLGLGASSNIGLRRFTNQSSFIKYFQMIDEGQPPVNPKEDETLTKEEREKEYIVLNMRLLDGFSIEEFNRTFDTDFLDKYHDAVEKHKKTGIIQIHDGRCQFTNFGLDVGNQFYVDIM